MSIINVLAVTNNGAEKSVEVFTFNGDDARGRAVRFIRRAAKASAVVEAALRRAGATTAKVSYMIEEV